MIQLPKHMKKNSSREENVRKALAIVDRIKSKYQSGVSSQGEYSAFPHGELESKGKIYCFLDRRLWFRGYEERGDFALFTVKKGVANIAHALRDVNLIREKGLDVTEDDTAQNLVIRKEGNGVGAYFRDHYHGQIAIRLSTGGKVYQDRTAVLTTLLDLSEDYGLSKP